MNTSNSESGFTLVEVLMAIVLVGVLSVISISYMEKDIDESRFDATLEELKTIKKALIGDEELLENGVRTSFGIQGDLGDLPASLDSLVNQGTLPLLSFDSTLLINVGWAGPYLSSVSTDNSILADAWGRNYSYDLASDPALITSLGADGVSGGSGLDADISISIPRSSFRSTVRGIITEDGSLFNEAAEVELNQPDGLGVASTIATDDPVIVGDNGAFTFSDVSYGVRSITIYIPSKAAPTTTIGPKTIIVDRPNFVVPTNLSAQSTDTSDCVMTADITYRSGGAVASNGVIAGAQTNRYITFTYDVNSAVTVSKVTAIWSNTRTLTSFRFNNQTMECSAGTYRTLPCNAVTGEQVTIVNNVGSPTPYSPGLGNNLPFEFYFSGDLTSVATNQRGQPFLAHFEHSNGCSIIYFNVP